MTLSLVHIALHARCYPMTFWNKLKHWPIVTLNYIEKFDSVMATGQINLPVGCAVSLLLFILYSHDICILTEAMKDP